MRRTRTSITRIAAIPTLSWIGAAGAGGYASDGPARTGRGQTAAASAATALSCTTGAKVKLWRSRAMQAVGITACI